MVRTGIGSGPRYIKRDRQPGADGALVAKLPIAWAHLGGGMDNTRVQAMHAVNKRVRTRPRALAQGKAKPRTNPQNFLRVAASLRRTRTLKPTVLENAMIRTLVTLLVAAFAFAAHAAVDVNKASQAELETVKGIGPSMSGKILDERKKGSFKDWSDVVIRVKGVGPGNATKFSADGLTVNGTTFKPELVAANKTAPLSGKKDAAMSETKSHPTSSPRK